MFIGFKEWKISERFLVRFQITDWTAGILIGQWTWVHIPMLALCINFTDGLMYGEEEEGDTE